MKKLSFLLLATTLIGSSHQSWAMINDENKENAHKQHITKKHATLPTPKSNGLKVLKNWSQNNAPRNNTLPDIEVLKQTAYKKDKALWNGFRDATKLSPDSPLRQKKPAHQSQASFARDEVLAYLYFKYGNVELSKDTPDAEQSHMEKAAEYFVQSCIYGGDQAIKFVVALREDSQPYSKKLYDCISKNFTLETKINIDQFIENHLKQQNPQNLTDDLIDQYFLYWTQGGWKKNPVEALCYPHNIIKDIEAALKDNGKLALIKEQQQKFFTRARNGKVKYLNVFAEIIDKKLYGLENNQDELNKLINQLLSGNLTADPIIKKLYVRGLLFGKFGFKEDKQAAELFLTREENKHLVTSHIWKANTALKNIKQVSDVKKYEQELIDTVYALIETAHKTIVSDKRRLPLSKIHRLAALHPLKKLQQFNVQQQMHEHKPAGKKSEVGFRLSGLEFLEVLSQKNIHRENLPEDKILATVLGWMRNLERQVYAKDNDLWSRLAHAIELPTSARSIRQKSHQTDQTAFNRKKVLAWIHEFSGIAELIQETSDLEKVADHFVYSCLYGGDGLILFLQGLQQHQNENAKLLYGLISNKFYLIKNKKIENFIDKCLKRQEVLVKKCVFKGNKNTPELFLTRDKNNPLMLLENVNENNYLQIIKKINKGLREVFYAAIDTALKPPHAKTSLKKRPETTRVKVVAEPVALSIPPVQHPTEQKVPQVEAAIEPVAPIIPPIERPDEQEELQVAPQPIALILPPVEDHRAEQEEPEITHDISVAQPVTPIILPVDHSVKQEELEVPYVEPIGESIARIIPSTEPPAKQEELHIAPVIQPVTSILLPVDDHPAKHKAPEVPHAEAVVEPLALILPPIPQPAEQEEPKAPQVEPSSVHIPPAVPLATPPAPRETQTLPTTQKKQTSSKRRSARKVSVRKSQSTKIEKRRVKTQKKRVNRSLKKASQRTHRFVKTPRKNITRASRKASRAAQRQMKAQRKNVIRASKKASRAQQRLQKTQRRLNQVYAQLPLTSY